MAEVIKFNTIINEEMRESKEDLMKIERDPFSIKDFENPTLDMQMLAVDLNLDSLQYIKMPFPEVVEMAINKNPRVIKYLKEPTLTSLILAYELGQEILPKNLWRDRKWKEMFAKFLTGKFFL